MENNDLSYFTTPRIKKFITFKYIFPYNFNLKGKPIGCLDAKILQADETYQVIFNIKANENYNSFFMKEN